MITESFLGHSVIHTPSILDSDDWGDLTHILLILQVKGHQVSQHISEAVVFWSSVQGGGVIGEVQGGVGEKEGAL